MMSLKICGCWRVPAHNPIFPFLQEIGTFYNINNRKQLCENGEIEGLLCCRPRCQASKIRWQDEKHLGALAINMMDGINKEPHLEENIS